MNDKATKTIRLDVPYPSRVLGQNGKDGEPASPEEVSLQLIVAAVSLKHRDNRPMSVSNLRIWDRIQHAIMDDNGKPRTGPLTLSAEQFDWLVNTMSTTQYPPSFSTAIVTYLDYLETLRTLDERGKADPEEEPEQ